VKGPRADALLIAGWLRSRLGRAVELEHEDADELESLAADGKAVPQPRIDRRSGADLLSDQLEIFARDSIYEAAVRASA
jgi:glucose-6-phosphate dehydrogenase assembly protein OpcA